MYVLGVVYFSLSVIGMYDINIFVGRWAGDGGE